MSTNIGEFEVWSEGVPLSSPFGGGEFETWSQGVPLADIDGGLQVVLPTGRPDPVAWPAILPLPLISSTHRWRSGDLVTVMDSGRTRVRRQFPYPLVTWEVAWNLTQDLYDEFRTFFQDTLQQGTITILLEIYGEEKELAFQDSRYSLSRSDGVFRVSAILEEMPVYA